VIAARAPGRATAVAVAVALAVAALAGCAPEPGADVTENRHDLELIVAEAQITRGVSDEIAFDIPAGVASMLIEVQGGDGFYFPISFQTPTGRDLIEGAELATRASRELPGLVDWMYPNGEGELVEEGRYRLRIRGENAAREPLGSQRVDVRVYVKQLLPAQACTLDLDFLVDPAAVTDEPGADGQDDGPDYVHLVQELIDQIDVIYSQIGVRVGHVTVTPVQVPFIDANVEADRGRSILRFADDVLEAARRHRDADGVPAARDDAMHIIMVRSVTGPMESGDNVAGYAMGLPGPYHADQPNHAVFIATRSYAPTGDIDVPGMATTLAHEMGHYLGLYHTSERNRVDGVDLPPDEHDPLPDTPECGPFPCSGEAASNNIMTPGQGSNRTSFSPLQGAVMRRHPLCVPATP
jgi:hypothetical protein